MLSDAFDVRSGMLLPVHSVAGWDEIRELFVHRAPNSTERAKLFDALQIWSDSVQNVLPISKLWVNGGFVTHKHEVPEDIDVVAFSRSVNFTDEINDELLHLITDVSGPKKIKPVAFGGKIDSYVVPKTMDEIMFWMRWWGNVRDPATKFIIPGAEKGFVEVAL